MKALCNFFVLLLASFVLASCGGGGGGSNSAFEPVSLTVTVTPASSTISTNSFTTVLVKVTQQTGGPGVDGATVNMALSPATIGTVSGSPGTSGTTATGVLSGGQASFTFNSSNQTGVAHLVASVTIVLTGDVKGSFTNSGSANITVTGGNTQDPRLQLAATTSSLPLNPLPYDPANGVCPGVFLGSPYLSEVTVTWRHTNGQLVSGTSTVNVSAAPTSVITFSTLNDTSNTGGGGGTANPCQDQFHTLLGSGPINVTGGVGTIYVVSGSVAGTGVLSVTATDPDSGQPISSQLEITVAGGASGLPASITAQSSSGAYVKTSGGISTLVNAVVTDGNGNVVADPSGYDNVQFNIAGPAGNDAQLSAVNAAGQTVTGTSVATVTHNGIASVTFLPGNQQGPVQVQATIDRADGNVDNGLLDPASASATVVVSDGKLFSLKIANPAVDPNLLPVISDASSSGASTPTPVYTVPVTVLGTDRQGNPVLAGTQIGFGLIDAPVFGFPDSGSGTFELSGADGNPQEGGTLFTAPTGAFTSAGAGAGPGDALVVFGKETSGDADLESARTVRAINNAGSLSVTQDFNLNDTTGVSVDTGSNIPYVIGRATAGNIDATAFTGADSTTGRPDGVASVNMRYPQSRIGQSAVVWAQGTGIVQGNGVAKTVADAIRTRYLGVGPATLSATPSTIFGNSTQTVAVCLNDAAGSPIPGVTISFSFSNLSPGTGTVNGKASGSLPPTGADGCVDTTVVTSGVLPGSSASVVYAVSGLSATVAITVGSAVLTAVPNYITSLSGATAENDAVTLTLKDGLGNAVSGATITGACTSTAPGSVTVAPASVTTTSNGTAKVIITSLGVCVASGAPGSGNCTFTYQQGSVTATANVNVVGAVGGGPSPSPVCN